MSLSGYRALENSNISGRLIDLAAIASLLVVTSCAVPNYWNKGQQAKINTKTKFSTAKYGVKSSPRITTAKNVKKGGGRYQVGKPYKIRGKWYTPKDQPGYNKTGIASWYGPNFHGRLTANGEIYDQNSLSAAHPTLPLPSYAKVTNLENGSSVVVRINDRGPFSEKRIIDLSAQASKMLGYQKNGLAKVRVRYLGKARMDGLDGKYLMASYKPPRGKGKGIWPKLPNFAPGASQPNTMIAMAEPKQVMPIRAPVAASVAQTYVQPIATAEPVYPAYPTYPTYPAYPAATPVAYYNSAYETQNNAQTAYIPVPARRPTPIYMGLPMQLYINNPGAFNNLQPLSFSHEEQIDRRIQQAFSVIDRVMVSSFSGNVAK